MFADHHLITWIVIGLVAGAVAGRVVYGQGFGCFANIVVGLAGSIVGGVLLRQFSPSGDVIGGDVLSDIIVSFIGAALLLGVLRLLTPRHTRRGRH